MGSQLAGEHYWGQRIHNFTQMHIRKTTKMPWRQTGRAFKLLGLSKKRPNLLRSSFETYWMYYLPYNEAVVGRAKMCKKFVIEWKVVKSEKHPTCSKMFKVLT